MGRKVAEGESEILECIRGLMKDNGISASDMAKKVNLTRSQVYNFVEYSKGTQLVAAEKILDALGYEVFLRKK